jgi:uncharacterized protein YjbI with pentapeptide repeats
MADLDQVARLKEGVDLWNTWRRPTQDATYTVPIDLSGHDFSGANLAGIDLYTANLTGADFSNADLRGSNLGEAVLEGARLVGTNLTDSFMRRARLRGADFTSANLTQVHLRRGHISDAVFTNATLTNANLSNSWILNTNFRGANMQRISTTYSNLGGSFICDSDLREAHLEYCSFHEACLVNSDLRLTNFTESDLSGANMAKALLGDTVFADTELSSTKGLDACRHNGPSVIDHRTLLKSKGLPLPFLRGVGLPDGLIDYLPSIAGQAIQYYSCFISYSSFDEELANRIHADLQNKGVRCWFAPHDMPIGGKLLDEIDSAIRIRDKVLLILSEHSIKSDWVEDEVTKAYAEERRRGQTVLFPIRIDDEVMTTEKAWAKKLRDGRHIGDFRNWKNHDGYAKSFERVLRDLKAK